MPVLQMAVPPEPGLDVNGSLVAAGPDGRASGGGGEDSRDRERRPAENPSPGRGERSRVRKIASSSTAAVRNAVVVA